MASKIEKFAVKFLSVFFCLCIGTFIEWGASIPSWHPVTRGIVIVLALMVLSPKSQNSIKQ